MTEEARTGAPSQPACRNCATPLEGPYCHACGQEADEHRRPILRLLLEAIESFTQIDGKVLRTLPALVARPGALARDYLQGRRARHVSPLRLFLVGLVAFTLSMEFLVDSASVQVRTVPAPARSTPVATASQPGGLDRWLAARVTRAAENPERFSASAFKWAHRLVFLALPLLALGLAAAYARDRRYFVYDHLVVSMQYLGFCFLLWGGVWLLPQPAANWVTGPAAVWTVANLALILRGGYGSTWRGAVAKAAALWIGTVAVLGLLVLALLTLALNEF
jgi:hypothetical protein